MKLHVLYGQRKCRYPGKYALEALACMDDVGNSDNPDYLEGELAKYEASDEFERLRVITLSLSEGAVMAALFPELQAIPTTVLMSS